MVFFLVVTALLLGKVGGGGGGRIAARKPKMYLLLSLRRLMYQMWITLNLNVFGHVNALPVKSLAAMHLDNAEIGCREKRIDLFMTIETFGVQRSAAVAECTSSHLEGYIFS